MFTFQVTFACGNAILAVAPQERDVWSEYPTAVGVECIDDAEGDEHYPCPPQDDDDYPTPYDEGDDMDGDAQSALASAGWGTDEDYGDYGYDDDGRWDE